MILTTFESFDIIINLTPVFSRMTKEALKTAVKDVIRLRIKFPQYVCGYDLVGQEDKGHSLLYFLDELLYPSMHDIRLPYFFHSGETGTLSISLFVTDTKWKLYLLLYSKQKPYIIVKYAN